MLNGDPLQLSHGWKPETGFLKPRWDTYSEDTILYLLAIGSPTHPISPASCNPLGAIGIRMKVTRISPPLACRSSCINMRTPGSTTVTSAKPKPTGLTTLKIQLKP